MTVGDAAHDVVIVGAGTAGCVLADRLSDDGRRRVLLIEAGGPDRMEMLRVPAGFNYVAFDPRVIYDYKTEPERGLAGRRIDYVRGRVLGGSSSVNAMVHVRGNRGDYDGWAADGCSGWGFDDVLPYFVRSERHVLGPSPIHGDAGPLPVTACQHHPATDAFIEAMVQSGLPRTDDLARPDPEGAGYYHQTVERGRRQSGARTYLARARRRSNVTLVTDATVEAVRFDGTTATGVVYTDRLGERRDVAAKTVILAGGAVGSSQLLELSGIGSGSRLSALGIRPFVDRPAVGENVQDHYQAPVIVNTRGIDVLNVHAGRWGLLKQIARYYVRRDGLLAYNAMQAGAFVKTRPDLPQPDLQLFFAPGAIDQVARPRRLDARAGVTSIICATQPRSRGSIHIRSPDSRQYPEIVGGYLDHEDDRRLMIAGIRLLRSIFAQPAFARYVDSEKGPGPSAQSDDEILAYCMKKGDSVHHPVGSCRMGSDPDAVVDPELRVRGVDGLYVIDASVMPRIVSGNTNGATVMIAEKGADLVGAHGR